MGADRDFSLNQERPIHPSISVSRANEKNVFLFNMEVENFASEKTRIVDCLTRTISRPHLGQLLWIEHAGISEKNHIFAKESWTETGERDCFAMQNQEIRLEIYKKKGTV